MTDDCRYYVNPQLEDLKAYCSHYRKQDDHPPCSRDPQTCLNMKEHSWFSTDGVLGLSSNASFAPWWDTTKQWQHPPVLLFGCFIYFVQLKLEDPTLLLLPPASADTRSQTGLGTGSAIPWNHWSSALTSGSSWWVQNPFGQVVYTTHTDPDTVFGVEAFQ